MKCVHCKHRNPNGHRGLCSTCYGNKAIRQQYPKSAKFAAKLRTEKKRPASRPTKHLPGTPEYLEVLRQRELAGEELWHPDDARRADE